MAKKKSTPDTNRTFRLSDVTLKRLKELAGTLELSENATVQFVIREAWEEKFPDRRDK